MPSIDLDGVREFSHVESPDGTPKGSRNDRLYRYACSLQAQGVSDEDMLAACMESAASMDPPLSDHEVLSVVRSAQTHAKGASATLGRRREAPLTVPPVPRMLRRGRPDLLPDCSGVSRAGMARAWLMALFDPEDVVCLAWDMTKGYRGGYGGELYAYAGQLAERGPLLEQVLTGTGDAGLWCVVNPLDGTGRRRASNVAAYRNLLVECDELGSEEQMERICALLVNGGDSGLPDSRAITWSGGKSWHAVVRVNADDAAQYEVAKEWTYRYCSENGLPVDAKCGNPTRFTRVPGGMRGDVLQALALVRRPRRSWDGMPTEWAGRG